MLFERCMYFERWHICFEVYVQHARTIPATIHDIRSTVQPKRFFAEHYEFLMMSLEITKR